VVEQLLLSTNKASDPEVGVRYCATLLRCTQQRRYFHFLLLLVSFSLSLIVMTYSMELQSTNTSIVQLIRTEMNMGDSSAITTTTNLTKTSDEHEDVDVEAVEVDEGSSSIPLQHLLFGRRVITAQSKTKRQALPSSSSYTNCWVDSVVSVPLLLFY